MSRFEPEHLPVGGQAVLGGVMMRRGTAWSLALRRPDGTIDVSVHDTPGWGTRLGAVPFVRGLGALAETVVLGARATIRSSRARRGDEADGSASLPEIASVVLGAVFAIGLFGLAPPAVADAAGLDGMTFHGVEASLRIALLVGYLALLGRSRDIAEVWRYHGAEHQAVNAYERTGTVDVATAAGQTVRHTRCGTTFLILVAILAIAVHVVIGDRSLPVLLASRVVALPLVACLAYETIRIAGRPGAARWLRPLLAPGIAVQSLTTRPPTDEHREVAVAALAAVVPAGAAPHVPA